MRILLIENDALLKGLKEFARRKPVFGTCAGMILRANQVTDDDGNNYKIIVRKNSNSNNAPIYSPELII